MGIDLASNGHLIKLMSCEDQQRYGGVEAASEDRPVEGASGTDRLERASQRQFASQLLLWNSEGRKLPFVWHSTAHRSKATPGTPDFIVGIAGKTLYIEFKRDHASKLSEAQREFAEACLAQGLGYHVVYSFYEAKALVEEELSSHVANLKIKTKPPNGGI